MENVGAAESVWLEGVMGEEAAGEEAVVVGGVLKSKALFEFDILNSGDGRDV